MILVFLCHLSVLKGGEELLQGRWTGGGHVLFAKYNLSYIIFVKSGLTPCTIPLSFIFTNSDCIFFKTFFTVLKPKETNSRVSDCYLTQTQQFSAIPWREQVNFQ